MPSDLLWHRFYDIERLVNPAKYRDYREIALRLETIFFFFFFNANFKPEIKNNNKNINEFSTFRTETIPSGSFYLAAWIINLILNGITRAVFSSGGKLRRRASGGGERKGGRERTYWQVWREFLPHGQLWKFFRVANSGPESRVPKYGV